MKKLVYLFVAGLSLFSCQKENPEKWARGLVDVVFTVTLPEPVDTPTRASTDTDIDNIDLLVFDNANKFVERVKVYSSAISGTGKTKSFTARLDASNTTRTIHIVANGRTSTDVDRVNFSSINVGMLESVAIPGLTTNTMTTASEAEIMPLIMWGRVSSTITSNTLLTGVKLLRSQAVITVGEGVANASNGLADFEILSATLHSAAARGRVAPNAYNVSATTPTTPRDTVGSGLRINYYTGNGYISMGSTPVLYLYERANTTSDYVALIIEGKWQGTPGYYKVVLQNASGQLNVVRNHRYIVTVVKAFGVGYTTIQEAVANTASNIRVNITDEREELLFIQADGSHELGVSGNMLKLWGTATSGSVDIATVFSTRSSSLSATSSISGLTSLSFSTPAGDGTQVLRGNWTGSAAQTGTITITDGLLVHKINVTIASLASIANNSDANSYCHNLFTAAHTSWFAEVKSGSGNVRLHPSVGTASSYAGGTAFGADYLDSRSAAKAFLHMTNTGGAATVKVSYMEAGNLTAGNIIINR